jgi:hypothetical protein
MIRHFGVPIASQPFTAPQPNAPLMQIEREMRQAGYVRSPNNIFSLPSLHQDGSSPVWYAGHPGLLQPKYPQEIQVCSDRIRIFEPVFFGEAYSRRSFYDTKTIAVLTSIPELIDWCHEHGVVSEPGLPAFANAWD